MENSRLREAFLAWKRHSLSKFVILINRKDATTISILCLVSTGWGALKSFVATVTSSCSETSMSIAFQVCMFLHCLQSKVLARINLSSLRSDASSSTCSLGRWLAAHTSSSQKSSRSLLDPPRLIYRENYPFCHAFHLKIYLIESSSTLASLVTSPRRQSRTKMTKSWLSTTRPRKCSTSWNSLRNTLIKWSKILSMPY